MIRVFETGPLMFIREASWDPTMVRTLPTFSARSGTASMPTTMVALCRDMNCTMSPASSKPRPAPNSLR
jgi:hypothetical protein